MNNQDRLGNLTNVVINKEKLISILQKNKENHEEEYSKAYKTYQKALRKELTQSIVQIKKDYEKAIQELEDALKQEDIVVPVVKFPYLNQKTQRPGSYVDNYCKTLKLLDVSVDSNFSLSQQDFENYVMDNWNWKTTFITSSLYNNVICSGVYSVGDSIKYN